MVAPSSPFDRERFDRGMARLAERYELAPSPSLLEKRCSKNAVKEYMDAHNGQLPPGVDWYVEQVVNVKR